MCVRRNVLAVTADLLVLRALGIGDLLVAVPALRGLRRAYPRARLVLATPGWLAPLVRLVGGVDELLPTASPDTLRWPYAPPGLAVNLHGRGPRSIAAVRRCHPAVVVSHRHPRVPELSGPRWVEDVHEVTRWARLLEQYGVAVAHDDLDLRPPEVPSPAPRAVVIHPGASAPARRWPVSRYAAVAAALAGDGARVVVTGSAAELPAAERVARDAGLPADAVLAGRVDLAELAALVAAADLVVAGDTGVGHLATAYRTRSVLLFGPMSPARWGPARDHDRHRVLWAGDSGDPHGGRPDRGLLRLTARGVLDAARELLVRVDAR